MAQKRMFNRSIIDSDSFIDMPMSARLLYYDLAMRADDDGFINSPKKVIRITGATVQDLQVLIANKFIIPFEDKGVVVIKHWFIHNYIRKDMYRETTYRDEKAMLTLDANNAYTLQPCNVVRNELVTNPSRTCNELVTNPSTQNSIDKNSIDKINKECVSKKESKHQYGEYKNVLLTDSQYKKLFDQFGSKADDLIRFLDERIEEKGYKYKNHYLVIAKKDSWVQRELSGQKAKPTRFNNFEQRTDDLDAGTMERILKKLDE